MSRASRASSAAIALVILEACAEPPGRSPLAAIDDAALCGAGPVDAGAGLIPEPKLVRRLGEARALGARAIGRAGGDLTLPSLPRVAAETGLEAREDGAGVSVIAVGEAGVREIESRCGVPLDPSGEAYFLIVSPTKLGGAEVVIAARTERGGSRAAASLASLVSPDGVREAWIADWPSQPRRGVLEGFYGTVWEPEERLEMLRFTWRARMNTLIWAPKDEIPSRLLWRFDWAEDLLAHLAAVAAEARALDVDFCMVLSPGIGILYGDPAEREVVLAKLRRFVSIGATCVALAFDDIPRDLRPEDRERYPGGIGEAQADLLADVFGRFRLEHPQITTGVIPVDYWTAALEEHPEYAAAIRPRLSGDAFIGWTGTEIVSATVTAAHVERANAIWGRAPFMGDNYPVVDGGRLGGRLQLGPVSHREPSAVTLAGGWVANAMVLPRASQIALLTIADQTWSPEPYEPEDSWRRALRRIAGPAAAPALERLAENARASALDGRESVRLSELGEAWLASFPAESPGLRAYATSLATVERDLEPIGPLALELRPWSRQLAAYGRAFVEALDLAAMAPIDAGRLDALDATARELAAARPVIAHGVAEPLLLRAIARLRR